MSLSTLLVLSVALTTAGLLWLLANLFYGKENVILAEAGPMNEADKEMLHERQQKQKREFIIDYNGHIMNTNNKIRIKVVGRCMEERQIYDGRQYYAQPIDESINIKTQIKPGEILLIYYPPKDIYKIRVFEKYGDGDELITFRYDVKTKEKKYSTRRHLRENVKGVLIEKVIA